MKNIRIIYEIARADFLQRVKQKSTLVAIVFMMYFSYLAVPSIEATYYNTVYGVDGTVAYRGIYNSTWIGFLITFIVIVYMTLIGFFLSKNTVYRDKQTRVGEIIATSDLKYGNYLMGKAISNVVYLLLIVCVMVLITVFLQVIRDESTSVELINILIPITYVAVPAIIITSILSVIFESLPSMQTIGGGITYFCVWITIVMLSVLGNMKALIPNEMVQNIFAVVSKYVDVFGINSLSNMMSKGIIEKFPEFNGSFTLGSGIGITEIKTFEWDNINWEFSMIIPRILWVLVALFLLFIAAKRFRKKVILRNSYNRGYRKSKKNAKVKEIRGLSCDNMTPAKMSKGKFSLLDMIIEEINLNLRGVSIWWFIIQGTLILNIVPVPDNIAINSTIPAAFIVPVFVLARVGTLDTKYNTEKYLYATPNYKLNQLIAMWLSVFTLMLIIGSSTVIKVAFCGGIKNVLVLIIGIVFITSLSVFLGVVSCSSTLFEVIYILLWYIGPLNKMPYFDFLGISQGAIESRMYIVYGMLSVVMIIITIITRLNRVKKDLNKKF